MNELFQSEAVIDGLVYNPANHRLYWTESSGNLGMLILSDGASEQSYESITPDVEQSQLQWLTIDQTNQ